MSSSDTELSGYPVEATTPEINSRIQDLWMGHRRMQMPHLTNAVVIYLD